MTAYNSANCPSSINTLEKDIIRQIMALRDCNPKTAVLEELNFTQSIAQWELKQNPEGRILWVGRAIIEINATTLSSGGKLWTNAIEVAGAANYPAAYSTN
jgi:hypothetical protein